MINFYIDKESQNHFPEISYTLKLWARNQDLDVGFTTSANNAVSIGANGDIVISNYFSSRKKPILNDDCFIVNDQGRPDFISTAFHLVNSLQEFEDNDLDELNRFKFKNSYQYKLENAKDNIVQKCFDEISKILQLKRVPRKSHFLLTHDVDMVNGAILEDGFNVLKKGRIDQFLKMHVNIAVGKPDWLNIDKIMK